MSCIMATHPPPPPLTSTYQFSKTANYTIMLRIRIFRQMFLDFLNYTEKTISIENYIWFSSLQSTWAY